MTYDILITSGTILDGTGREPEVGDIGVKDGKIAAIGKLGAPDAALKINALDALVTPGFIDVTNHSDTHLTLFKNPGFDSFVSQGVTTVLGGNCGASLAPLASHEALQAIRKWADPSEINVNWTTFEEFLQQIAKLRLAVNFGSSVGYGTLRRGLIDDEIRQLTYDERETMRYLITESMEQGSFGLSFGLSYGHERISTTEEIIDIAKILAGTKATLKIHMRSEGVGLLGSVNEVVRIARETGVSVQISHMKAVGRKSWHSFKTALDLITHANESGADINFDVSPYATTGSLLYMLLPSWSRAGGLAALFKNIDDPVMRNKIVEELKSYTLHYDRIAIRSSKIKGIVGRTIAELAAEAGVSPEETLINTVRATEGRASIIGRTISGKNVTAAIMDSHALVASDGQTSSLDARTSGDLEHPRSFGAFPHFWHRFVTDSQKLKPEIAIQKITSGPAMKFGIEKRGMLKVGNYADIVIFDPKTFKDQATYRDPFAYPVGLSTVIVNGKLALREGALTGERAGQVLRKK
ncbi:MAG: amidohydrolase family protein [Candidatus Sungbacteria bacterium]|nr:amidohydrolase family protein [Candidatus Sungbacteria bacterium]